MKILMILMAVLFVGAGKAQANNCQFSGKSLQDLGNDDAYELQFSIKVPFPPKLFKLLEKYFGKFSKEKCANSIEIAKIKNKRTSESYLIFYTNQTQCDGGNSYGIIFKESDTNNPYATIEDSYIDCEQNERPGSLPAY